MTISKDLIRQAVSCLSEVEGVYMNEASLVEDVFLLACAFPEEDDFMAVCASTRRALEQLVGGKVISSELKYEFDDWSSYHFQHRAGQGVKATCRIVYRRTEGGIEAKGLGRRRIPEDFCKRMSEVRL